MAHLTRASWNREKRQNQIRKKYPVKSATSTDMTGIANLRINWKRSSAVTIKATALIVNTSVTISVQVCTNLRPATVRSGSEFDLHAPDGLRQSIIRVRHQSFCIPGMLSWHGW